MQNYCDGVTVGGKPGSEVGLRDQFPREGQNMSICGCGETSTVVKWQLSIVSSKISDKS